MKEMLTLVLSNEFGEWVHPQVNILYPEAKKSQAAQMELAKELVERTNSGEDLVVQTYSLILFYQIRCWLAATTGGFIPSGLKVSQLEIFVFDQPSGELIPAEVGDTGAWVSEPVTLDKTTEILINLKALRKHAEGETGWSEFIRPFWW